MSSDEESDAVRDASRQPTDEQRGGPTGDPSAESVDATGAAIADIEARALDERAPGYQALAERLRVELEQSDPHAAG